MKTEAPLGVFDSGVGGLTVVQAIRRLMPQEDIIYLGDTARVPYGGKSPDTIRRFSGEISTFLQNRGVKAIVVACNTASAHALKMLQEEMPLPVFGVIRPGVETALEATRNGRIGIIGTTGTIRSQAYQKELTAARPELQLYAEATPLLVPLVEENWLDRPASRLVVEEYLSPLLREKIDTLVLACTHYPLLKPLLQQVAGEGIRLVDSAAATALHLQRHLQAHGLARTKDNEAGVRIFLTDMPIQFSQMAERFLQEKPDSIEIVSL